IASAGCCRWWEKWRKSLCNKSSAGRVPSCMRSFPAAVAICFIGVTAVAQRVRLPPAPPPPQDPNISRGPVIGTIDYYGLRKVALATVQKALGVREGDLLPFSKGDVEQRLDAIPGVVESHLEAVCCANGRVTVYVGIEERGAGHFE